MLGLKANLDVSIYAKSDYEYYGMKEIREELENEKDI